ncbi:hypothetical protein LTR17_027274, partial [Elasticomyces elasticus]
MAKVQDLNEAVEAPTQAVQLSLYIDVYHARSLHNLGRCLGRFYERTGETGNLTEAITTTQQAI